MSNRRRAFVFEGQFNDTEEDLILSVIDMIMSDSESGTDATLYVIDSRDTTETLAQLTEQITIADDKPVPIVVSQIEHYLASLVMREIDSGLEYTLSPDISLVGNVLCAERDARNRAKLKLGDY